MNRTFATIRVETHEGIGWLRLARPHARNAISVEMLEELLEVISILPHEPLAALVLTGDGQAFCAGLDLSDPGAMFGWLAAAGAGEPDPVAAGVRRAQQVPAGIAALPYPTIAAVHGAAIGGGLELALACDLRLVARGTRLAMPEVAHGLIPDWGGTQRLSRLIGLSRATELILACETLTAERARDYGLAHRLVQAADLEFEADTLACRLRGFSATALREAKQLLAASLEVPLEEGLRREASAQSACARSPEARQLILTATHDALEHP